MEWLFFTPNILTFAVGKNEPFTKRSWWCQESRCTCILSDSPTEQNFLIILAIKLIRNEEIKIAKMPNKLFMKQIINEYELN